MSVQAEVLKAKLESELQAIHVEVRDESGGCGQSYSVVVVSEVFNGKGLLQRHRLVNQCLQEEIKQLHAFSQKTYTPEQWKTQH